MQKLTRRDALKAGTGLLIAPALYESATCLAQEPKASVKPDRYADAVLIDGEPPLPISGSFTVAVLPDTQLYSWKYPETYFAQTRWLIEQRDARNIAAVLHLGDITHKSTTAEWEVAQQAMRQLDGVLPYFITTGNHDYEGNRTSKFSQYFPVDHYRDQSTFGGTYDQEPNLLENSFHRFSSGGRNVLVLALEWGPRKDVVRWANGIVSRYPDHEVILVTHAYMYHDDTRYDWNTYGKDQLWSPHGSAVSRATNDDVMDGEELWNHLVSRHENFIMTLNGHVLEDGLGRLTSQAPGGRDVHQMLVNFQMRPNGGDGWLRLLEFLPDGKTVEVRDYSPVLQKRNESPQNRFTLALSPSAGIK